MLVKSGFVLFSKSLDCLVNLCDTEISIRYKDFNLDYVQTTVHLPCSTTLCSEKSELFWDIGPFGIPIS